MPDAAAARGSSMCGAANCSQVVACILASQGPQLGANTAQLGARPGDGEHSREGRGCGAPCCCARVRARYLCKRNSVASSTRCKVGLCAPIPLRAVQRATAPTTHPGCRAPGAADSSARRPRAAAGSSRSSPRPLSRARFRAEDGANSCFVHNSIRCHRGVRATPLCGLHSDARVEQLEPWPRRSPAPRSRGRLPMLYGMQRPCSRPRLSRISATWVGCRGLHATAASATAAALRDGQSEERVAHAGPAPRRADREQEQAGHRREEAAAEAARGRLPQVRPRAQWSCFRDRR